ncbi:nuclear transport factor 2 family protein [Paracoccus sp. IB05]|nr:nuclear transport factor 2 family protein [Paracoccus sp. IB05]
MSIKTPASTVAVIPVRASHKGAEMAMNGIGLLWIEGGRIREVRQFSEDQAAEDRFWG